MSEATLFSPEGVDDSFSFQIGENKFGFKGGLTKGKFSGNIRGEDGQEFAGFVEDLGGGRYRVEDWESGRMFEPSSEQPAPVMAEALPGLADATAVVAMEAEAEQPAVTAPTELVAEAVAELPVEAPKPVPVVEPEFVQPLVQEPGPQSSPTTGLAESIEKSSMHPTINNTINRLQEIRREVAPQAEEAKSFLSTET